MAVVLPSGWTNFQGGGSNPALCDQGIPPSISIPSGARSFNCTEEIFEILLEVLGGVPPFTWETTRGRIEVTGPRTSTVFLHNFQSENTVNCGALGIRNDDHAYRRTGFAEFSLLDLGPRGQLIGNGIVYNCNNEPVTGAAPPPEAPVLIRLAEEHANCSKPWASTPNFEDCNIASGGEAEHGEILFFPVSQPR